MVRRPRKLVWLCGLAGLLGSACAAAGELPPGWRVRVLLPAEPDQGLQWSLCAVGDVDGDGGQDFAVLGRTDLEDRRFRPWLRIVDADTLDTLVQLDGVAHGRVALGIACDAGDLDGDGTSETAFAVSAMNVHDQVVIALGDCARVLRVLDKPTTTDSYGRSLAGLGDVDGDGLPDLLVAASGAGAGPSGGWHGRQTTGFDEDEWGVLRVHSGRDGAVVHELAGGDHYGSHVVAPGDLDGDGVTDFVVAAGWLYERRTWIDRGLDAHSGRTGERLWHADMPAGVDQVNTRWAPLGDVDGDGVADFAIGKTSLRGVTGGYHRLLDPSGRVMVFSGRTGRLVREHAAAHVSGLGSGITATSDIDGDGVDDYAATSGGRGIGPGALTVFSGRTGDTLHELRGVDGYGASVAFVRGRLHDHLVVSAPGTEAYGRRGCLYVYSW